MDLIQAIAILAKFNGTNLTGSLAGIESKLKGVTVEACKDMLPKIGAEK